MSRLRRIVLSCEKAPLLAQGRFRALAIEYNIPALSKKQALRMREIQTLFVFLVCLHLLALDEDWALMRLRYDKQSVEWFVPRFIRMCMVRDVTRG